jgi:regulatory protein
MPRRQPNAVPDPEDLAGARRVAIKILKTRMVSRAALVGRLVRKGYSPATASAAATEMADKGLIDDRRLAESLVRKQLGTKAAGKRVLVAKVRQRGIAGPVAEAAAAEGLKGRDLLADAVDLARRKARGSKPGLDPQVLRQRVFAYLARRGFDGEVCRRAVERALGNLGDLDG